ncbi:MAG: amino acid permease [Legionella sp.]|nr:amino acid permease [Legionella sp.]
MKKSSHTLKRRLNARILSMIALGGSIGTGIFLASAHALSIAGPGGTLLAYVLMGLAVYFVMGSLGEMAAFLPSTGSFYMYAARFFDPSLGYALGWNYWYSCAVYIASELAASSLLMRFWFPDSPPILWCALFLTLILGFNAISTRVFGEIEYWMSFIKVTVIILFVVCGFLLIAGVTPYKAGGFANWQVDGGPFRGSWIGFIGALVTAGFSFQGTEMIGVAAGESSDPQQNIPKAIKMIFWRILLFFVLSLFVISLLIPSNAPQLANADVVTSPFTLVFTQFNENYAAFAMNVVILIAIISTANSSMYIGSRILWFLAKEGHMPHVFSVVNHRGVPIYALAITSLVAMLAFLSSIFGNGTVYFWLLNATSLSGFIAWMGISISHYRFRKAYLLQGKDLRDLPYVAKGYPFAPMCAFMMSLVVICGQNYSAFSGATIDWYGIVVSYICIPVFMLIWLIHKWYYKTRLIPLMKCDFSQD